MENTIAVVGGGIAGLALAYEILQRSPGTGPGLEVVCLEASDRAGGNIRTDHSAGFTCEWGPNGFLDNAPATLDLVKRLGMAERLLASNARAEKRFIFRGGRLRELPSGAREFLFSDVLSRKGRLRVLTEPFRRAPRDGGDESVFDFASRRIGREAAEVLVDAMVSGIHAGDARALSVRSTFPKLWQMEAQHGSLTRAMLARRKERGKERGKPGGPSGPGGRLMSFVDGLQELTDRLAASLGGSLRLGSRVQAVWDMGVRGFRLHMAEGAPIDAAVVVLAAPAWFTASIVETMDATMSRAMAAIPSASVTVVHQGLDEADLGGAPDGFGYLVPRGEGPRILGTLWSSSIFPHRAPEGKVLLTTMIGGANDPQALDLPDDRLIDLVRIDLGATMGLTAEPYFVRIFRHPRGIPQYTLGHQERIEAIERRLVEHPGLFVCGNSYRGVSLNLCVEDASRVALKALSAWERKKNRGVPAASSPEC